MEGGLLEKEGDSAANVAVGVVLFCCGVAIYCCCCLLLLLEIALLACFVLHQHLVWVLVPEKWRDGISYGV